MAEPDKSAASTLSDKEEASKALADWYVLRTHNLIVGIVSECTHTCTPFSLFSQYPFFLGGIGVGTLHTLSSKTKSFMPVLVGGMAGTVADLVYGYTVVCVTQVEATKKENKE
jgi:hypothetical protein